MRELQDFIGYHFQKQKLLQLALTHRSFSSSHNERLEFLGDSLLNFIIGNALYQRFPAAKEGDLSRLRAQLVKGVTLTQIAGELQLGKAIRLGSGERKANTEPRDSILADAVEALIGAIYLDSNVETVEKLVLQWFEQRLNSLDLNKSLKDPKSRLQEILQSKRHPLPDYAVTNISGKAHQQLFTVECRVQDLTASGSGRSRKVAEQLAAAAMLEKLEMASGQE